jgi:hypothetical protein
MVFCQEYIARMLAADIQRLQPTVRIWAWKVATKDLHDVSGPRYPEEDPGTASGFPGAFIVQLHQNCQISVQGQAKAFIVDLSSACVADPGAPGEGDETRV